MNKEPIRVLHVVGCMDRGGIETMIMNLYRNIDRDKIQFDFLAHYGREAAYNDEIRSLGGRIYEMPALKDEKHVYYWRYFTYVRALHKFFREHREYRIVHGHMTNTASIYMPIAKKYGVKTCIAHSHSTQGKVGLLGIATSILQKSVYKHATDYFACSEAAAKWFYPQAALIQNKVVLFPNAIDVDRFCFNPKKRDEMRSKLGLEGKTAIGCIGRFRPEKNQGFLIDVMKETLKMNSNATLVFVGDGPCEKDVQAKVVAAGIEGHVCFLGARSDVCDIMQALDVLAMPSLFEGMPVVGIEAQASGLPIVASTGVSHELGITENVFYLPLENVEYWTKQLMAVSLKKRIDGCKAIEAAGYDVHFTSQRLQEFYLLRKSV